MKERRKTHRRHNEASCDFPRYSGNGAVVDADRRKIPERRLNDISVEELSCEDIILEISGKTR